MHDHAPHTYNPNVARLDQPTIPLAQSWLTAYDGARGAAIDMSQAVPGYPPHPDILHALGEAAASREAAAYGAIEGDAAFRHAYADHVSALYGAQIEPGSVLITAGCNQAFVVSAMALAAPGDTILLTNPNYFNHAQALAMLGVRAETVSCTRENAFLPSCADVEAALGRAQLPGRIAALAIVTPNNPTGAIYSPDVLAALAGLCRGHGIRLIVDETYRDFLTPGRGRPHDLFSANLWEETVVQLYSFSKAYCVPGHRLGAITAGPETIRQIAKVMDNLQICAPRAGQIALTDLIASTADWRTGNAEEIARRATAFRESLAPYPSWEIASIGAYFAYVRHPFRGVKSRDVAEYLARRHGVLCLPGSFFGSGQDDFLRVAFANVESVALRAVGPRLDAMEI